MRYVRFHLHAPPEGLHPLGELLRTGVGTEPDAIVHLDSFADGTGVVLYHLANRPTSLAAADDLESVHQWEVFSTEAKRQREWYCYAHVGSCGRAGDLLALVHRNGLLVETPIEFAGRGTLRVTVAGTQRDLHTAFERLGTIVDYEVTSTGEYAPTDTGIITDLTPRQRTVLQTAIDLGYYDVPKGATHADIASQLGCATSTVDEHLRKAESRVFESVLR